MGSEGCLCLNGILFVSGNKSVFLTFTWKVLFLKFVRNRFVGHF